MAARQLKIKLGACKRLAKEVASYEKEASTNEAKVRAMKEEGRDAYDVRKAEEILAESCMMIPDSKARLQVAVEELAGMLAASEGEDGVKDTDDYADAKALVEAHGL
eukprot:TRINITY_DN27530_c0_g1_i1.p1 TRINITY_DN27530_c0_g1~~TRINITY_DN27530_c0_g1_i1.p1  ORF type:complete len:107 (+),score=38.82 TRINITY_DN27530_c0_g1_i1:94-414(+)